MTKGSESASPSFSEAADGSPQAWEEQYRDLASLAGGLAHEVRNPLGTIQMNVQLLAEDLAEPQNQHERRMLQKIEVVGRECQRLASILDDFLRFARVSELDRHPTDLNELVRDVVEFSRPRIESAEIVLRDDLSPSVPTLSLDADLFRQAILNLLLNAESACQPGDELILRTREERGGVTLDVIDTGRGMAEEVRAKIFRPFFSTRSGGSGLGLPTTKRIIDAHGGAITVESEPSRGTAFHIWLPTRTS
jgi:two-component system sensor histidine kinase HydH